MNQYARVIRFLDDSIGGPDVGLAAHDASWQGFKRDEFIASKVFNYDLVVVDTAHRQVLSRPSRGRPRSVKIYRIHRLPRPRRTCLSALTRSLRITSAFPKTPSRSKPRPGGRPAPPPPDATTTSCSSLPMSVTE